MFTSVFADGITSGDIFLCMGVALLTGIAFATLCFTFCFANNFIFLISFFSRSKPPF